MEILYYIDAWVLAASHSTFSAALSSTKCCLSLPSNIENSALLPPMLSPSAVEGLALSVAEGLTKEVEGWIPAVIFLIIEKNEQVRFDAMQALVLSLTTWVIITAMTFTLILALFTPLVGLASILLHIVLAVKAYQGQKIVLPVLGSWAEKALAKVSPKS